MALVRSSVHRKLLVVVLATTALALAITGAAMVYFDLRTFRRNWDSDLTAQADILGLAAVPALEFEDPGSARAYLALLEAKPDILGAAIYTASGEMFARYTAGERAATGVHGAAREPAAIEFPQLPDVDGIEVAGDEIAIFKQGAETAAAQGHFVHVYVDRDTQRPVEIPAPLRAALEPLRIASNPEAS